LDGILVIDKPEGPTSHDVVARVRRILKTKRVGHTGTLDPFATGVMVLPVGKATRLSQFLDTGRKLYLAEIRFGFETDTGDRTGTRNAERGMRNADEIADVLAKTDWDEVFSHFRGEIEQVPPMYSAKKIDGKKLYELARAGKTVERKAVRVDIHSLTVADAARLRTEAKLSVRVACSAGTYIRTLAEDIGRRIGVGAHLTALRREASGKFDLRHAFTLDGLEKASSPADALIPIDLALSHLPAVRIPDERIEPTRNGLSTRIRSEAEYADGETVRIADAAGNLLAIGRYDAAENSVQPKIVLV
jgi:tRNA pseudouridine55 synthase